MVGKTEGKTRMSRRDEDKKAVVLQEKEKVRTYGKSPKRGVADKSPTRLTRARSPIKPKVAEKASSSPVIPATTRSKAKSPQRLDATSLRKRSPGRPARKAAKSPPRVIPPPRVISPARIISPPAEPVIPKPRLSPGRRSISRRSPIRKIEPEKVIKKIDTVELDSDSESQSEISEVSKSSYIAKLRKSLSREMSVDSVSKRTTRLQEFERVVHLKNHYEPVAKLTEFSDEDEIVIETKREEPRKQVQSQVPKLLYMNLFMTIIDLVISIALIMGMLALCNDLECSFKIPNSKSFNRIFTYFDRTAILYTSLYYGIIFALSALPFCGRKCHGPLTKSGKFNYNMNGLFCAFITFFILAGLEYYTGHAIEYIYDNVYKLLMSTFVLAFVFSTLVYAKSFYVPLSNLNGSVLENTFLFNYVYGCENNPRFGRIDMKTVLFRANYISSLIIWSIGIYYSIVWSIKGPFDISNILNYIHIDHISWTALTVSMMTTYFILDALVFEHTWMSTAELQYESFGLMKCMEYCVFFNFFGVLPKYILDYNVQLETWKLVAAVITYTVGYVVYRGSILQKHAFRENPYSPQVAHLESIPSGGKKIICSSYWGFVRHPNYLGDIIINISYIMLIYSNPLSILNFIWILKLFQRAHSDNTRCKKRYGTAWDRYSQRVKYMLIPKVY